MRIRILGSAAGGGFPQWNCGCGNCVAVRTHTRAEKFSGKARTQAQLALSADGSTWFLAGASPDLTLQIENSPDLHPRALPDTPRDSPIAGVVLGSCDLDHVAGLLLLRELQPLRVYAAPSILRILREENSMFGMLNRVEPQVVWTPLQAGAPFPLLPGDGQDSGLRCEVCYLSGRYPKYVRSANLAHDEATAALFFESSVGKRVAYVPAIGSLSDALLAKVDQADLLLFDGTFWSDDELIRVQGSGETAREMGHVPVSGPDGSLGKLAGLHRPRKVFIHINNTNPMLDESGPQFREVRGAGWEIAEDKSSFDL